MSSIFEFAEACLYRNDIDEKLTLTHRAMQLLREDRLQLAASAPALPIDDVSFPARPLLLPPRAMPNRKLTTPEGVAAFFHAIGHVEFVAIYLAWDLLYRFRDLPEQFYRDWLRVADEEAQHFALIREHLRAMSVDYGDLPAHGGLWEHATDTAGHLLARLALVPRCMEARGLDVTPALIEKFRRAGDSQSVAILTRILTDEVGHVELGSYWFKFVCREQGLEPEDEYRRLLDQFYKGGRPKGPFNRELRIQAGFSAAELDWLER
ncbi:ferritin-like domain-containing protein [Methylomicrobium sp. Wu6]|uniref:ferritin-like domain-containing protein n=1 Tax=Methylomicrobium sp. Wu6 TaxID=3107928 RepID=UPI002DD67787|nr:ferritin-like domain-containing protein [Methylomicrobium sp. Wu6]MEC4749096.1 ferritin-like domain-containing protein [Methylomicrobium sp. Wu6]